ncbi:MAG: VCBS repeat-containing protein [Promethearchaeota archaeon]|nr:MAG: VCBS repeat-containing protein [Candidatus Lokiarchaeota archaeon]
MKIRKKEQDVLSFKKARKICLKLAPVIIEIFIIITIFSKQYGLTICISIILIGYLLDYIFSPKINKKYRSGSRFLIALIIIAITIPFGFFARGTFDPRSKSQVWIMHKIDNPGLLLPNGLDVADVNGDGFLDYLTNYEWDGKIRIAFHPGLLDVKKSWPAITIGSINNAENAAFGDFDGDGNYDVVVAHGSELFSHSGVFLIWGPTPSNVMDASAWLEGGDIQGTQDAGQFHYVKSYDINGDNATDIVVGGRGTNPRAGLKWIEAPISGNPRNLSLWQIHNIDPNLESGHGFVFGDIDKDGDEDIALCNSDWDTADVDEKIIWYENPGPGNLTKMGSWPKRIVYQGSEFYSKEQVTLYDFTGDNYPEIIMQTKNEVYIFKNPQNLSSWELVKILKPPETQWRARTIKIGDINDDKKPDILGMLIHYDGLLPISKAAVFWMEFSGVDALSANWQTHVIKWGDGFIGIGMYNGEKWDQCMFIDIDRDGDIDIVANCEEFHTLGFVFISVVWFENPTI